MTRLFGKLFDSEHDNRRDARGKASTGYDDFAGQIRGSLDRFENKRRIPYSIISLILISLAALIGPIFTFRCSRAVIRRRMILHDTEAPPR